MISFLKKHKNRIFAVASFFCAATYLLSLNSSLFFPSLQYNRTVLSQIIYPVENSAERYRILKVKDNDKIIIEIYKIINEYNYEFMSRIDTGSKYEGYFLLGGNATNLAFINIDDDPTKEIIVPGFDLNLTAHLNVIKFDSVSKSFTQINHKFDFTE